MEDFNLMLDVHTQTMDEAKEKLVAILHEAEGRSSTEGVDDLVEMLKTIKGVVESFMANQSHLETLAFDNADQVTPSQETRVQKARTDLICLIPLMGMVRNFVADARTQLTRDAVEA